MKLTNIFSLSLPKRFSQIKSWIKFKLLYPKVPIINPLSIGTYHSQFGQDLYLSTILYKKINNGEVSTIVDIGANDPIKFSNSLFFEKMFNTNVFAIEPIKTFEKQWIIDRPKSKFLPYAVGSKDIDEIVLNIPNGNKNIDNMFSSVLTKTSHLSEKMDFNEFKVPCYRLDTLFDQFNLKKILFISIDVEGFELEVLNGIDFEKVKIDCFLIENNTKESYGSEPIRDFLKSKGYIFYSRIYCADDVFISKDIIGII
jgi:FkbM family methyltransferase